MQDAAAIATVHVTSRAATMPYLPPQTRSLDEVTRWVGERVLPGSRVWVAEDDDGAVVGYAALDGDHLDHLYLLPGARRRGFGTALLDEVREAAGAHVELWVFQANVDAQAFYRRHGFEVVEDTDGSANMERLPDYRMAWTCA